VVNLADAKLRSLKTLLLLIMLFMVVATQLQRVSAAQQSQYPTVLIINPLSPTNASTFDLNTVDYPINSTFTAAVYITAVTNLTAWQVELAWDNNIMTYATAWIPTDNVFKPATDNGATLIQTPPATDYDNFTHTGYVIMGCTNVYTPNYPNPWYPVNVENEALLFYVNFTVAVTPNATQTLSTNLAILKQEPNNPTQGYLASFVFIFPSTYETAVLAEPAEVSISGSQAVSHRVVDVSVTGITCDPGIEPGFYRGYNVTITTNFANNGTDLEKFTFNLTETYNTTSVELVKGSMTLLPNSTDYYTYVWLMPSNLPLGNYTIEAQIQPPPGQNNTQADTFATVIYVDRTLSPLEYMGYLISVALTSRLGILFMIYAVGVICFFSVLFARERLKMRSLKLR